jgi:hypothetical protein
MVNIKWIVRDVKEGGRDLDVLFRYLPGRIERYLGKP